MIKPDQCSKPNVINHPQHYHYYRCYINHPETVGLWHFLLAKGQPLGWLRSESPGTSCAGGCLPEPAIDVPLRCLDDIDTIHGWWLDHQKLGYQQAWEFNNHRWWLDQQNMWTKPWETPNQNGDFTNKHGAIEGYNEDGFDYDDLSRLMWAIHVLVLLVVWFVEGLALPSNNQYVNDDKWYIEPATSGNSGAVGMKWNSLNSDVHDTININETDKYA